MFVRIIDYGQGEVNFVNYLVGDLSQEQRTFLDENLDEKTSIDGENLLITLTFSDEMYPFQSKAAQFRLDDFISREEIEMNVFLSGFMEDM